MTPKATTKEDTMSYTADNMSRFLGPDATDHDAQRMGEWLEEQGWELTIVDGEFHAYRNGEEMTEQEWQDALHRAFAE